MRIGGSVIPAFLAAGAFVATAHGDEKDVDRFLKEYPEASRAWQIRYNRVRGSCITYEFDGKARKRVCKNNFAVDLGFKKVEIERLPDAKADNGWFSVYCLGPDSAFILDRMSNTPEFSVSAIEKDPKLERIYDRDFGSLFTAPFSILGVPLSDFMTKPTFRVVSAATRVQDGHELMHVDYEVGRSESPDRVRIEVEPALSWGIRKVEVRTALSKWRDVLRYDVEYDPTPYQDWPRPRRVQFTDRKGEKAVCEIETIEWDSTPRESFSMTAYGLPDLSHPQPPGSAHLAWLVGLGIATLLAASGLTWIARRSSRPA
jgi:hypothetical protein